MRKEGGILRRVKRAARLISVIWILLSACGTPQPETVQTPAPVGALRAPHERVDNVVRKEDTILLVSFFNGGRMDIAQHTSLTGERVLTHTRRVENWTMHGAASPLAPEKFESLHTKLAALPENEAHSKDEHAFFVSWRRDGEWITRNYDLTRLPAGIQQLFPDLGIQDDWLPSAVPKSEK